MADVLISLPVFFIACWMAFTNPFTGERIGMIVVAAAALLVMLPSVLMVCRRKLSLAVTLVLSLLYGLMFLAGGYVLVYDLASGPKWWLFTIGACLGAIAKSIVVALMVTK